MNEMQTLLSDTVTRLFTDRVTTDLRESAEKGQWPAKLWQDVEEGGLTLTPIPEARGGGGGTWQDAYIVVAAAGRFGVPLPIAETMVGAWLLAESGLDVPLGPLTVAPVHAGEALDSRARRRGLAARRHGHARAVGPRGRARRRRRGGHGRARPGGRRQRAGRRQPGARAEGHADVERGARHGRRARGPHVRRRPPPVRRARALGADGGRPRVPPRPDGAVRERAQAVRPAHRELPGHPAQPGAARRSHGGGRASPR